MKILIVRLSSLGDVLHLFPAVSDLRRHYPDAVLHWLVEPAFAELASWHSAVDRVITVPLRAHKKTWWKIPVLISNLRKQLRAERYDFVLDAQGLLKSALLARLAGAPVCGYAAESAREPLAARLYGNTARTPPLLHVIEKNRRLVAEIFGTDPTGPQEFGLDQFRRSAAATALPDALAEITHRKHIVLLHGTTWNSKYWPEAAWAELIRLFEPQGWVCLLPWGNQDERLRAERLQACSDSNVKVLPRLSLTGLVQLILRARSFVSVESGIGHIAAAMDVPGVMLHGPTSPDYSGILGKYCRHITSGIYCSPCFKRDCPRLKTVLEIPPCQIEIKPSQVLRECLAVADSDMPETAT